MRSLALVVAVVSGACSYYLPHPPQLHPRPPRDAKEIALRCDDARHCHAVQRGIVTRRGHDPWDWFRIELPACTASQLSIRLSNKPPRDDTRIAVALRLWDARMRPIAKTGYVRDKPKAIANTWLGGGTYYLGVGASWPDGAGSYELTIDDDAQNTCGSGRDLYLSRPEDLATPAVAFRAVLAPVMSAGVARSTGGAASLVIDASDPRVVAGARGVVLTSRGIPVRYGDVLVDEVFARGDARFASVQFVHPGTFERKMAAGWSLWTVALQATK